jgi:anti-sigma-K factor RskA
MIRLAEFREDARFWHAATAVLLVATLALLVAAIVCRPAPVFATRRAIAVLAGIGGRPAWAIRLAPAAHLIAVEALQPPPAPAGRVYQLWLSADGPAGPQQLGLLPEAGREAIPVTPENARRLSLAGQLFVTLEPAGGSPQSEPSGRVVSRGGFAGTAG